MTFMKIVHLTIKLARSNSSKGSSIGKMDWWFSFIRQVLHGCTTRYIRRSGWVMARRELLSRNCQVELEDKNQCINDYGDAIPRIVLLLLGSHPGTYTCTCITFIHSKSLILLVISSSFFNMHCIWIKFMDNPAILYYLINSISW